MNVEHIPAEDVDMLPCGEDCFPKYTKQFLKHYYDTNEIF